MKIVAQVKLLPTPEQADALKQTMVKTNEAANRVSEWAFQNRIFKRFDLHRQWYETLRLETGLTAQIVALLFAKVADAYKLQKATSCTFRPLGAITYDSRVLRYYLEKLEVSVWANGRREKIPFVCGDYQTELLKGQRGETDLIFVDGQFYLMAVCDVEDPPIRETNGVLGIDLGIVELASDSEGRQYSGAAIKAYRRRLRSLRAGLQKSGTKSAKRHLKRAALRGSRYTKWLNHNISRQIVQNALLSGKALALESLTGIRERGNGFNREMRWQMGNWAFEQLRGFIEYKAKMAGIIVYAVDPRNTSRTCSACGHCDKANRKSQSHFLCLECGFSCNADLNASVNIAAKAGGTRADVTQPIDGTIGSTSLLSKPPALAGG